MDKKTRNQIPFFELERLLQLRDGSEELILEVDVNLKKYNENAVTCFVIKGTPEYTLIVDKYLKGFISVNLEILKNESVMHSIKEAAMSEKESVTISMFFLSVNGAENDNQPISISFAAPLGKWSNTELNKNIVDTIREYLSTVSLDINKQLDDYVERRENAPFDTIRELTILYTPGEDISIYDFVRSKDISPSTEKHYMRVLLANGVLNQIRNFIDESMEMRDMERTGADVVVVKILTNGLEYEVIASNL